MVNINDLKQLIKTQNQSWIKVDNYEFLYQKMGGEEMIKIGSKGNATNDVYVDILVKSIVDWKGVKVKDLLAEGTEHPALEEEVKFDRELFDQFLSIHLNIVGDLFKGIDGAQIQAKEDKETRKKK